MGVNLHEANLGQYLKGPKAPNRAQPARDLKRTHLKGSEYQLPKGAEEHTQHSQIHITAAVAIAALR